MPQSCQVVSTAGLVDATGSIGGYRPRVHEDAVTEHDLATPSPPGTARVAAGIALIGFVASLLALGYFVVSDFVVLLLALVCFVIGVPAAWVALTRRGLPRLLWVVAAVFLLLAVLLALASGNYLLWVLALVITTLAGAVAFRKEIAGAVANRWRPVPPARHAVLLMNPKSGGGKVEKFGLVDEARKRGIEPIVLAPGDDVRTLAERAVQDGADVVGMAGGDGSQAIVASVAAAHDLAFVCVPAGTRNHLALDLGVDRKDVVGALDAFGAAREARIDLADVNGRVFVNNVSLGVYAEIVRRDEYRNAKAETVSTMLPGLLGPGATPLDLQLQRPDGRPVTKAQIVLVSNGAYVFDRLGAIGTRPRLDSGHLGVVTLHVGSGSDADRLLGSRGGRPSSAVPGVVRVGYPFAGHRVRRPRARRSRRRVGRPRRAPPIQRTAFCASGPDRPHPSRAVARGQGAHHGPGHFRRPRSHPPGSPQRPLPVITWPRRSEGGRIRRRGRPLRLVIRSSEQPSRAGSRAVTPARSLGIVEC